MVTLSLLQPAIDMLRPMVDMAAVPPVAMDRQQVAMVQPAQPVAMGQRVILSAQTMQFTTGRTVSLFIMDRLLPIIKSQITVGTPATPPTVAAVAMAR